MRLIDADELVDRMGKDPLTVASATKGSEQMAEWEGGMDNAKDEVYVMTEWGCLFSVLNDYGVDLGNITPTIGEHMVSDFMNAMVRSGYVLSAEGEVGHWIYSTNEESVSEEWSCDKCDSTTLARTPYCPFCGAKMEVDDETD